MMKCLRTLGVFLTKTQFFARFFGDKFSKMLRYILADFLHKLDLFNPASSTQVFKPLRVPSFIKSI
jgi:hypothetical protein